MGQLDRITQQPDVMGGRACIRGMRVTVGMVLGQIGMGHSVDEILSDYPYLSSSFQFTEKIPGTAPYLADIHSYTFAAMPSLACSAGISALKFGVDRIAGGISRALFVEDADLHLQSLRDYDEPELDPVFEPRHSQGK